MRVSELLKREGVTFSLEVFPPKTSDKYTQTAAAAKAIAALVPDTELRPDHIIADSFDPRVVPAVAKAVAEAARATGVARL